MADLRDEYRLLIDPVGTTAPAVELRLLAATTVEDAAGAVEQLLGTEPAVEAIVIVLGGDTIGITTRTYLRESFGYADSSRYRIGDSDAASLPGGSTGYTVLRYRCPGSDHRTVFRAFHDERDVPVCAECGSTMELT